MFAESGAVAGIGAVEAVEVLVKRRWWPLGRGGTAPTITESQTLHLRGFDSYEDFNLSALPYTADAGGHFTVQLVQDSSLRGHLGLIEVTRSDGAAAGEIEIAPDKLSEPAYEILLAELQRLWAGLIFDPGGVNSVQGALPTPATLWHEIEGPISQIAAEPRSFLTLGEGLRKLESVRRPCELTPSVLQGGLALLKGRRRQVGAKGRAGAGRRSSGASGLPGRSAGQSDLGLGSIPSRPGRGRALQRSVDLPENTLAAEALRRLVIYARRHPDGAAVARSAMRALNAEPFVSCGPLRRGMEAANVRTINDPRYRRVERVLQVLRRPEVYATEGPGEARLGIQAISRLFEYWVFLRVLEACYLRYGPPAAPGFAVLSQISRSGTTRLVIGADTTVSFPGDVHVAFEPHIHSSALGWQQLENVPHPHPALAQNLITPDVVVLRRSNNPSMLVVDAKYTGRHMIDYHAAKTHGKYARVRLDGTPGG